MTHTPTAEPHISKDAEYAVTRVLIDSRNEAEALPQVLAAIGGALEWTVGAYWGMNSGRTKLVCCHAWHRDASKAERYLELSRKFEFQPGVGLPGRVWESAEPIWIADVTTLQDFPRLRLAAAYDLHGGVGFPVFAGRDMVGVIEFFTTDRIAPSDQFVRTLEGIGSSVGSFIKRVQIANELTESEHRFRTLAETASDAIVTIDEQSIIRYANAAVVKMFGYLPDELIGARLTQLMPENMRAAHDAGIARYVRSGKRTIPWSGVQLPALHKSGREFPIEISFSEFTAGGKRAFTGILRDVTDRVRQQQALEEATVELEVTVEELQERTREAEAAARVKTEFLAAMSHELRTPLQAVIGYAGLLTEGIHGPMNDEQDASIQRIHASATHLLNLIDQVLDIARSEAGTLRVQNETFDLCALVAETAELVRPQAEEKGLELAIGGCPDGRLNQITADPGRIRQIVLNLLSNAVKFTQAGRVGVEFGIDDARARIIIKDTGVGIATEHVSRVFEKFYQTEAGLSQRQPGMGLGLAISRELAQTMSGEIVLESVPGHGSTFTLLLPIEPKARTSPRP